MAYLPNTAADQRAMLDAIGAASVEELLHAIPAELRFPRMLDIPPALTEIELTQHIGRLAAKNLSAESAVCFLGGGAYDHFIPAVVDEIARRGENYTAYTPYQAEASQGTLQAIFEYQTSICELTGLDVANASLYDAGSGVAEAVLMAGAVTGRSGNVVVAESLHPEYRQVLATFLQPLKIELRTVPTPDGILDPADMAKQIDAGTLAVVAQSPNFFGCLERMNAIGDAAHAGGALFIDVFDPIAVGLLKKPSDHGADIAVAEGQGLGNYLIYGGPYLGILACRQEFVRKIPGRLVGETTDRRGNRCFVLTLQTREQHIRRDKATSNICSNQGLLALRATVYLAALGPQGLRETAELCARKAKYAANELTKLPGVTLAYGQPFFKEFTLKLANTDVPELVARLADRGYLAGLPLVKYDPARADCLLVAVTEKRTKAEIDGLVREVATVLK